MLTRNAKVVIIKATTDIKTKKTQRNELQIKDIDDIAVLEALTPEIIDAFEDFVARNIHTAV